MTNTEKLGLNRTGIATSPIQAKEMLDDEGLALDIVRIPEPIDIASVRQEYARSGDGVGTVPPPPTVKGAVKSLWSALKGEHPLRLIDKLGERLAFERSGTRLYQALVSKHDTYGSWDGGPSREDLRAIMEDELVHFHMLRAAIIQLGADPTVVTPAAEVADLAAMGLRQIVVDPRIDLRQSLQAALTAELVDNDCWRALIALIQPMNEELAERFEEALLDEDRHLIRVRAWVLASMDLVPADVIPALVGAPLGTHE